MTTMSAISSGSSNTAVFSLNGKPMNLAEYQQYLAEQTSPEKIRATAQQQAADRLQQMKDLWKVGFDQRQQEAETNASRAFGYRQQESERDFGQRTAFSSQDFNQNRTLQSDSFGQNRILQSDSFGQNRTLQSDYLGSQERRDAAQIAARERIQESGFGQERDMASLRSNLKQREKSEDRTAAIAAFRNRR